MVWRETADLPEDLIFNVNYLGGNMPSFALNFSRPGGQIIAQYYNFVRLGREGYGKIHLACYDSAKAFAAALPKLGPFEVIYGGDPALGIPCVSWKLRDGAQVPFSLYDLADRLRIRDHYTFGLISDDPPNHTRMRAIEGRCVRMLADLWNSPEAADTIGCSTTGSSEAAMLGGWQVPAYSMPAHREDLIIQRILVRHGVSADLISLLLEDLRQCIAYFDKHPVTYPADAGEAGGYHH